jgi:hypothetical protein
MKPRYFFNLWIALDQLVNAVCGGWADESLSARAHRQKWKLEWWIDLLFGWEKDDHGKRNHCKASYEHEMERRDLPPEYRECGKCKETEKEF